MPPFLRSFGALAVFLAAGCELVVPSEDELSGGTKPTDGGGGAGEGASAAGAGVTFVTSAVVSVNNGSSMVVTLPEAPREGDLLLAIAYDAKTESSVRSEVTPPAGWTKQFSSGYWWTFYGFAPAGSGTTFTFEITKTLSSGSVALAVYRGVDLGNPISDAATALCPGEGTSGEATCSAASVTTARPQAMLVILSGVDGADGPAWTPPEGMTERGDLGAVAIADATQATTGPSGPKAATHVATGWSSHVNLLALAPRL